MQPGSCADQPVLDVVSAFQSYGKYLEMGQTEEAEKYRYDTVRNSCHSAGGACGGECLVESWTWLAKEALTEPFRFRS